MKQTQIPSEKNIPNPPERLYTVTDKQINTLEKRDRREAIARYRNKIQNFSIVRGSCINRNRIYDQSILFPFNVPRRRLRSNETYFQVVA